MPGTVLCPKDTEIKVRPLPRGTFSHDHNLNFSIWLLHPDPGHSLPWSGCQYFICLQSKQCQGEEGGQGLLG